MKTVLSVFVSGLFLLVVVPAIHAQQMIEYEGTVRLCNLKAAGAALTGELTNISGQELKGVELTVLYLDPDDHLLGQENVYPLQQCPSPGLVASLKKKTAALKAGETIQFNITLREIPQDWSTDSGKYHTRVTRIEFDYPTTR